MAQVKLEHIRKSYDKTLIVKDLSLDIPHHEFLSLVGPSGCGKSTTLRMIAGLEEITEGKLYIGDRVVNNVPPKERNIAMVFQSYALFPHMNVAANIAFGLKIKKVPEEERKKKIEWALELMDLKGLGERMPKELSGGQRQRVAVGRALVLEPQVLLMDEPLSNLDAKLRLKMRTELKRIHKNLNATVIYVTHDQVEAMTLSDKIAIMNKGDLMQYGTPHEVYNRPANKFVAGFIGSSPMNFMKCTVKSEGEQFFIVTDSFSLSLPPDIADRMKNAVQNNKDLDFGIRPEDIYAKNYSQKVKIPAEVKGRIDVIEPLGSENLVTVVTEKNEFKVRLGTETDIKIDDMIELVFDMNKMHLFRCDGGEALC